jgi:hypothetical protein
MICVVESFNVYQYVRMMYRTKYPEVIAIHN